MVYFVRAEIVHLKSDKSVTGVHCTIWVHRTPIASNAPCSLFGSAGLFSKCCNVCREECGVTLQCERPSVPRQTCSAV